MSGAGAHVPVAPSGRQYTLRSDGQEATVVEVGGGLRRYRVDGRDVLDGYGEDEICSGGRGQVLVPWPNRVRDGRYGFGGSEYQLALTEAEQRNAIHGLARFANWEAVEREADHLLMRLRLHPQSGYPFALDLELGYRLDGDGLSVTIAVTNIGTHRCPYGAGMHPYLTVGTAMIDDAVLTSPAGRRLETDARQIPTGSVSVAGTEYDFRAGRSIGDTILDTAYTDLARDADGRARVRLRDPASGHEVELWMDESFGYLMLFTGDTLSRPARRRGLAVEPMTCPPNALQSGEALAVLEPGERRASTWGLAASR